MDYVPHDLVVLSIWIALMHIARSTTGETAHIAHILHLCLVHSGDTIEQASSIIEGATNGLVALMAKSGSLMSHVQARISATVTCVGIRGTLKV